MGTGRWLVTGRTQHRLFAPDGTEVPEGATTDERQHEEAMTRTSTADGWVEEVIRPAGTTTLMLTEHDGWLAIVERRAPDGSVTRWEPPLPTAPLSPATGITRTWSGTVTDDSGTSPIGPETWEVTEITTITDAAGRSWEVARVRRHSPPFTSEGCTFDDVTDEWWSTVGAVLVRRVHTGVQRCGPDHEGFTNESTMTSEHLLTGGPPPDEARPRLRACDRDPRPGPGWSAPLSLPGGAGRDASPPGA